ncbi:unnamed protein product [Ixodes hexagonus]
MALFLSKFVKEINALGSLTWQHNSSTISSRVYALCCCVDAPARAEVRNHSHFNGYFGCPWCLASGEHLEGYVRYRGTLPDEERTSEGVRRDMELATQTGRPVNGVKGPSPLVGLPLRLGVGFFCGLYALRAPWGHQAVHRVPLQLHKLS